MIFKQMQSSLTVGCVFLARGQITGVAEPASGGLSSATMASYTGGSREASRIQALEQERQQRREEVERKKESIAASATDVLDGEKKFASTSETADDFLKTETVGLVTHADFKKRREYLERCAADEREKRDAKKRDEEAESRKQRLKRANKATLSFADDDEGSDDSESDDGNPPIVAMRSAQASKLDTAGGSASDLAKKRKIMKNPKANTSFLPDRERELAKQAERERLEQEWTNEQERIKNEMVRITYSYWNGSGHRRVMRCKKGMTVGRFLAAVQGEFKELRHVSAESLMYIKEDLIIPPHYSFYDFIVTKARGVRFCSLFLFLFVCFRKTNFCFRLC